VSNGAAAPLRVALVGCGDISADYVAGAPAFPEFEILACCDVEEERAKKTAAAIGARARPFDDVLADPDVEAVLNLTPAGVHALIVGESLEAGKHVYTEKPLATDLDVAADLVALADERGLVLGCAPDTFLSPAAQALRRSLDAEDIGTIVGIATSFLSAGPDAWHPEPRPFYHPDVGPLFDLGPYPVAHLVSVAGPVARVHADAVVAVADRVVGTGPHAGTRFVAEAPTHVVALLRCATGTLASMHVSYDVAGSQIPQFEVEGSTGSLSLTSPTSPFEHDAVARRFDPRTQTWDEVAAPSSPRANRGIGLADMAVAIREGRRPRASGELGFHVVEVLHAILRSSRTGDAVAIDSRPRRPDALDADAHAA
jgi:predicted dehydrogenase